MFGVSDTNRPELRHQKLNLSMSPDCLSKLLCCEFRWTGAMILLAWFCPEYHHPPAEMKSLLLTFLIQLIQMNESTKSHKTSLTKCKRVRFRHEFFLYYNHRHDSNLNCPMGSVCQSSFQFTLVSFHCKQVVSFPLLKKDIWQLMNDFQSRWWSWMIKIWTKRLSTFISDLSCKRKDKITER